MRMVKRDTDVYEKKIGENHILYKPENNMLYSLNKDAFIIWDLCSDWTEEQKLIAEVRDKYKDVPVNFDENVEQAISKLYSLQLLMISE